MTTNMCLVPTVRRGNAVRGAPAPRLRNFSVVTFTTLGYGDFKPVSWLGKCLVVTEVMVGYAMLGLLVGIIARRVIGR